MDNQADIYSSFKKRGQGGLYTSTRTLLCVFPCIFTAVEEMEILCKSRFCVYAYFKDNRHSFFTLLKMTIFVYPHETDDIFLFMV